MLHVPNDELIVEGVGCRHVSSVVEERRGCGSVCLVAKRMNMDKRAADSVTLC